MNAICQVDLDTLVEFPNGEAAKFQDQPLSFRTALERALMTTFEGDQNNPVESRMYRMTMVATIKVAKKINLTLTEVVMLTELLRRAYHHPAVVFAFLNKCEASCLSRVATPK